MGKLYVTYSPTVLGAPALAYARQEACKASLLTWTAGGLWLALEGFSCEVPRRQEATRARYTRTALCWVRGYLD